MKKCCLCSAIGEDRDGSIPEGWGFPICDEHYARSAERARKSPPPFTIVAGARSFEQEAAKRALAGDDSLSLIHIVRPADATLQ